MTGGLLAASLVLVLAPTLALAVLSTRAPAAAPAPFGDMHVVSAEHPAVPEHHPHPPWCFIHWCFCPGLTASLRGFHWSVAVGLEVCPTAASPTAASPGPTNPAPGGAATFPATVTLTSPPPSPTTSVPAPSSPAASPATPPATATVPATQPAAPQPNPAARGGPAGYPRTQSNLLLRPAAPLRAGLPVRLLMILVLIPCAAAGVLRYGGKR
jgi:hypothetical protein